MTQNAAFWTDKHNKFSLKNKVTNVASSLWRWIMTLGKEGEKIELCLKDFGEYVAKHRGKPFAHWWVKKQFAVLESLRVISIEKSFGSNWYRVHLRHPAALEPIKKLNNQQRTCEKHPSNPQSAVKDVYSSSISNIEVNQQCEILKLCAEHGIYYDPFKKPTQKLFEFDLEDIELALNHYEQRKLNSKITDPQAWLIGCLKDSYWLDKSFGVNDFIAAMERFASTVNGVGFRSPAT